MTHLLLESYHTVDLSPEGSDVPRHLFHKGSGSSSSSSSRRRRRRRGRGKSGKMMSRK